MRSTRVTRRTILSGIGLGTATLFANPLLRDAFAQKATTPRRLLVLCMPNCSIKARWAPTGGRTPSTQSGDATAFQWGFCNEPLEPVRKYVSLLHGLDHKAVGGDPHGSGFIRYLTGGTIQAGEAAKDPGAGRLAGDGNMPKLPSIDQLLLAQSKIIGDKGLALQKGLQLAVDTRGRTDGIHFITLSYSVPEAGGKPLPMPPENTPYKTYARVVEVAAPGSSSPEQQTNVIRELAKKRSVLDFVKNDLGRLQGRLGNQQRMKLESHLTGLREYEQSLSRQGMAGPQPKINVPPTIEMVAGNTNANYGKLWDQYHDMAKLCFQLDLVRTITINYGHGNQAFSLGAGGLHGLAHSNKAGPLADGTKFFMGKLAGFIQSMAAVNDFDGGPLIDNTVITLSSDVSEYHNHVNVPFVVAGGKNLGIAGGRVLNYPGGASNDVFSSLLKPLGIDTTDKFGDPIWAKGPLPEFVV
jgi:hypothetical protein